MDETTGHLRRHIRIVREQSGTAPSGVQASAVGAAVGASVAPARERKPSGQKRASALSVSELVGSNAAECAVTCEPSVTLVEVAQRLLEAGQSVCAVVQEETLVGLIDVDDILKAYLRSTPWDCTAAELLNCTKDDSFQTVLSDVLVADVFPRLVASQGSSSHHRFYSAIADSEGRFAGVLTPYDFVRVMADSEDSFLMDALSIDTTTIVSQIMQPLDAVPRCAPGHTIQQLLRALLTSPSRVVLLMTEQHRYGFVTAVEALWAFQQQLRLTEEIWLHLAHQLPTTAFSDCHPSSMALRIISCDDSFQTAASTILMPCNDGLRTKSYRCHLVCVEPSSGEIVGIVCLPPVTSLFDTSTMAPLRQPCSSVTVGDVVAERETAACLGHQSLKDACFAMTRSGRTAALVMDGDQGCVHGVLTENDILHAIVTQESLDSTLERYLRGSLTRLPGFMLSVLTLPSTVGLVEAAAQMASMASHVPRDFACHHVVVFGLCQVEEDLARSSRQVRLLSALDVARGLAQLEFRSAVASQVCVAQAMKPCANVPQVSCDDCLSSALLEMMNYEQNCAIVVERRDSSGAHGRLFGLLEGESVHIRGVITTTDALRTVCADSHINCEMCLDEWWQEHAIQTSQRIIHPNAHLWSAAAAMMEYGVHHLIVADPDSLEVVGVLSALDIVLAICKFFVEGA
eukprot:TRINITY_DN9319_c0_g2_i2.p1 TRINITY_DN9319_c0_g2~~TRINITY_DN9319_c0_g2_i2.p1  ORF type:complete len:686 (-),score=99.27 TRINITY_DN9319_c0_g2_i2:84-2141(-)